MNKTNNILVVIVIYNGMKWLRGCFDSVVNSSILLDAYIIDNGSIDGSQQFIITNYPQFSFYQSPTNSGFGAANNIGLKYAIEHNYDYIYLLNQDAWVEKNTISTLVEVQKLNPEYGILSPLQVNADKKRLDLNFFTCCPKEMLSDSLCNNLKPVYETNFTMAAHWLISSKCLLEIGGFSPSFPHYGEDHNLVHRALYKNYKIGIVPSVYAIHDRADRIDSKKLIVKKVLLRSIVKISNINLKLPIQLFIQPIWMAKRAISLRSLDCLLNVFVLIYNYPQYIKNRRKSTMFSFLNND